jgi:GNAT superfamily N-acetyltransferase
MTPEQVRAAAAAWVWIPDTATTVETDDFLLVRFPDYFEHPLELVRFTPTGDLEPLVDEALARARELETPRLWWWVRGGEHPGLEDLLVACGGELDETLDVLALDLTTATPAPARAGLELRWQTDLETVRDAHVVATEVFGGSMPPEDQLHALAERGVEDLAAGLGGTVLAYVDGTPVGTGGLTMADGVARLWGGGVRAPYRRQGVYAALLAARLAYAREQAAHLALVKGRVETSGPILQRAGFAAYGRERSYRLPLAAPTR